MEVTPLVKEEFMIGALIIAKEQSFIWAKVTDAHDEHLTRLYNKWGGDNELRGFGTTDAALTDFRLRLISGKNRLDEKMKDREREISINALSCKIEIPIGNGRMVEFAAAGQVPIDSTPDEKKYYYGQLFQACFQGFMEFKQNPPMQLNPQAQYTHTGDTATEQFEFHTITVEVKNGKRYFNVIGDKFPLHGVPVYHEVLAKAGIASEKLEATNTIMGTATYMKNAKGQASKIVHIQVMS